MRNKNTRQITLTRRALVFGGLKFLALGALFARLYHLQFIKADQYKVLAEGNRVRLDLIAPIRGVITDRNDVPMANNEKNFRLYIERAKQALMRETLQRLAEHITLRPEQIERVMKEAAEMRSGPPVLIKEHLSWDELSRVEIHSPTLAGVFVDVGQLRYYPYLDHSAHLIGHVGAVTEAELAQDDEPVMHLPEFKIGKNGIEKGHDLELRGKPGISYREVNVHSVSVRELDNEPSTPGKTIRLTVDNRLQEFAANRLEGEGAAAVVMDVNNGDILALSSVPGFDPNQFSVMISKDYWKQLMEDKMHPLLNKAITGQYPPGSTFKMMVGLAAISNGIDNHVYCPGHFFLGNHRFNCWKPGGHGTVNLTEALAQSCDTYFYTCAKLLGIDKIASVSRKFGLGELHDLNMPNEKPGIMPDAQWKMKRYKQQWQAGDTINVGIGQGYVLATPLQLAVMTARIANGGYAVKPRLIMPDPDDPPLKPAKSLGFNPAHIDAIRTGMDAVTNGPTGTARGSRITLEGMAMAGKTGTSQVRRITIRGQDQSKIPREQRHHALFVGYAPNDAPKYAVAVLVEHGGGGASAAAPVARDILIKAQMLAKQDAAAKAKQPILPVTPAKEKAKP